MDRPYRRQRARRGSIQAGCSLGTAWPSSLPLAYLTSFFGVAFFFGGTFFLAFDFAFFGVAFFFGFGLAVFTASLPATIEPGRGTMTASTTPRICLQPLKHFLMSFDAAGVIPDERD